MEELLDAARAPVFFLDEHRVVRPGEMGTVHEIDAAAQAEGLAVRHVNLDGQFRCGGSRAYEEWVLRLLGLVPGRSGPVGRRRPLLRHSRRDTAGTRSDTQHPPDKRDAGAHDGRFLLALERTAWSTTPGSGRASCPAGGGGDGRATGLPSRTSIRCSGRACAAMRRRSPSEATKTTSLARRSRTAATRLATGEMTPYGVSPRYTGTPMAKVGVP
ncbi:DNA/RNA helicase domain-containing protein [Streptomyces sp. NPDC004393]